MKKNLMKTLSVLLSTILIFQTIEIGVFAANEVYLDVPKSESSIEKTYTREMAIFSGVHSKSIGRAGIFFFNDFSLIPELSFDVLNVSSNIYPIMLKMNFNSPEQRFIESVCGVNFKTYGDGWFVNYGKFICEVVYNDLREIYLFDGAGNCEIFVRNTESLDDEDIPEQFSGRQKWVSKYALSDTVIWKIPDRYIDYSSLEIAVPEQYAMVSSTGEISRFDAFGRLREKKNPESGALMTIDYLNGLSVPTDAVSKIVDGMGNEFRFTYSENYKLQQVKVYDSTGEAIIAGNGEAAKPLEVDFLYTADYLTEVVFPDGKSIYFTYDTDGNITSAVNIDMKKLEIEYSNGVINKLTEKAFDELQNTYISGNELIIVKNSELQHTFIDNFYGTQIKTFDADGRILTITDENGNYLYGAPESDMEDTLEPEIPDDSGEDVFVCLCPCEDCTEYECSCECESEDVCECIQCKRSMITEYDEYGNVISTEYFDGTKTFVSSINTYSEDGSQLVSSVDSSGNTVYYSYNDAGFIDSVASGEMIAEAEYDAMGNLLSFSQSVSGLSDGNIMSNEYSYENDRIKTISHNGFTYDFEYDVWGNSTKVKIGNIVLSENTYGDGANYDRLSRTTFANGQSILFTYDENNNITAVSYDEGLTSRYLYAYDENGILESVTDNLSGIKTIYTDNGTELRKVSDNTLLFSNIADENGNVTQSIAADSITYVYDEEYNSVSGVYTDIISFEKNGTVVSNGVAESFTTNASIKTYTDWFGRVTNKALDLDIISADGNCSLDSSVTLTYTDTENTATTKVNSLTSSVTNGINTVLEEEYYEYDSTGNITGIYKLEENEKVYYNKYYYDEANQIVREDNRLGDFTSTYVYDVGGNIVERIRYPYTESEIISSEAIENHTYSYENSQWGDVLTAYNGQPVTYDAMGNVTSLNGDTYTWTAGRQLSRITKADNSYIDYFYDDNGQLSMYKMYDAEGSLNGGSQYYWEGTKLIAVKLIQNENDTDSIAAFMRILYDSHNEPLGFLLNDAMPFLYTKNILGDITGVVYYETADYLFRYAYDAYGNYELITEQSNPAAALTALLLHSLNPLTYRGYAFAPAVGICHYLGSRFYSPMLCRFMNADIYIDTAQGVVGTNMFAYCNNNPIRFVDPEGTYSDVLDREKNNSGEVVSIFTIFMLLITAIVLTFNPNATVSSPNISISVSKVSAKDKAIAEIKNKVKNNNKSTYWKATLKKTDSGDLYVELGGEISYSAAVERAKNGKSVFTTYSNDAYKIAKNAGIGIPLYHSANSCEHGQYPHYHLHNHSNDAHIWYIFVRGR